VEKYRYMLDEDINGKVVEHVTDDGHPFELITKTCWEMDGAESLRFPQRLYDHRTKVNAVTRGQPGQDTSCFNDEMWMDLDDFFQLYNRILPPKKINSPTVEELIAMSIVTTSAGLSFNALLDIRWQPVSLLAFQDPCSARAHKTCHLDSRSLRHLQCHADLCKYWCAAALAKVAATGKTIVTPEDTPGVVYHRTTRGNWKGILDNGFIPGVGNEYLPAELIAILARLASGLRAERPVETRVAMQEAVRSGVVFIKTASEGILTTDVVPAQFVVSVDDTEKKVNLYRRHRETVQ